MPELYNHEAETALAGAALLDNELFIAIDIEPSAFHLRHIRALWREGQKLVQAGSSVNSGTLPLAVLEALGGADAIVDLINRCPSAVYGADFARTVGEYAERRQAEAAAHYLAKSAHQETAERHRSLSRARQRLQEIEADWNAAPASLSLLSADEILTTIWPEPVWAVPDLLPAGLTILAGKPKLGKSWLALQLAQSVASGGMALGEQVEKGPILYLALEDPPRRLKQRMQMQSWAVGLVADFMTVGNFMDQIGNLRNGGGHRLARQIEDKNYRMVVIDTLSRTLGSGDQNDTSEMTAALTPIQEMAHELNCAVVMIDHHRKGFGGNPDAVGDILGSTAKGAMADCIWGLYRERGKSGATLTVTGRDIVERSLAIRMDWLTGCWQVEGDADKIEMTDRRREIIEAVADLGASQLMEIVEAVGQDKSNTYRRIQDLVGNGYLRRFNRGRQTFYEAL